MTDPTTSYLSILSFSPFSSPFFLMESSALCSIYSRKRVFSQVRQEVKRTTLFQSTLYLQMYSAGNFIFSRSEKLLSHPIIPPLRFSTNKSSAENLR